MWTRFAVALFIALCLSACASNTNQSAATSGGLMEQAMRGDARIIDLGYSLSTSTPYWPTSKSSPFKYEVESSIAKDHYFAGKFEMPEHLGTHLDAPAHFSASQPTVDKIEVQKLVAPAVVIDVSSQVANNPDYLLSLADVKKWEAANGTIPNGAVIMLRTGWSRRYNNYASYKNEDAAGVMHFPGYSQESAQFLVQQRNINGIGIDTMSVDYGGSQDFPVHQVVNGAGRYHLENVANLDLLPPVGAVVVIAPIKLEGGSGGPARIFAFAPK